MADPQDVDDAAYAAARYLCASGADLATGSGWSAAVFSYNHSDAYVRSVYDAAQSYADRTVGLTSRTTLPSNPIVRRLRRVAATPGASGDGGGRRWPEEQLAPSETRSVSRSTSGSDGTSTP